MTYRLGLFLGLAALLGGACETTLDVDLPDHPPQITANSFFRSGAAWDVQLTEARSVADGEAAIQPLRNATVEILEEGGLITRLLPAGGGFYRSLSVGPVPGRTYTLCASAPGYPDIVATDSVPTRVPVTFDYEITRLDTFFFEIPGQDTAQINVSADVDVTIQLSDPPDQNDYYRLFVLYRVRERETGDFSFFTYRFKVDDEVILAENGETFEFDVEDNNRVSNAVFSDALFDGEQREITINLDLAVTSPRRRPDGQSVYYPGGTLQVNLYNLSKTYYDYSTTYGLHRDVRDNPFAEPVRVHTNIQNGFGIFAGFNRYLLSVDFPEDTRE